MISEADISSIAEAAAALSPAASDYRETDFVMNLLETVLDYMQQTEVVVKALTHYRSECWDDIRTIEDLELLFTRFSETREGNLALAQHLWGYNMWTRAQQLRDLVVYFRSIGVIDQDRLRRWAARSYFKRDFEGRVKGLGPAVYQWLVMRQGVDTVKPDVHVRRFAEAAVGHSLNDQDLIDGVSRAAHLLGIRAYELDWRIWEASRGGSLPYPAAPD